jgi:hypothetical protein
MFPRVECIKTRAYRSPFPGIPAPVPTVMHHNPLTAAQKAESAK